MRKKILVGTHHKTGSRWMDSVFFDLCRDLGIPFVDISTSELGTTWEVKLDYMRKALADPGLQVLFDEHSQFPLNSLTREELAGFAGMRLIRDPRDMAISAARYHTRSDEPWLHVPRPEFDGMTYHDRINSLPSFEEQLLFEMDNSTRGQVEAMVQFDGHGVIRTWRYEDLIEDLDLVKWHEISIDLGLEGLEIVASLRSFWNRSLFGGADPRPGHVNSGRPRQHEQLFTPRLQEEFQRRFAPAMATLGYD